MPPAVTKRSAPPSRTSTFIAISLFCRAVSGGSGKQKAAGLLLRPTKNRTRMRFGGRSSWPTTKRSWKNECSCAFHSDERQGVQLDSVLQAAVCPRSWRHYGKTIATARQTACDDLHAVARCA